jgi:Ni,Fe-hydrogenase III large subunit
VIQVVFSSVILLFCLFQLARTDIEEEKRNAALYWSCVTGILALWMPSPSSKNLPASQTKVEHINVPDAEVRLDSLPNSLNGKTATDKLTAKL